MISLDELLQTVWGSVSAVSIETEVLPLVDAVGRVCAHDVFSPILVPQHDNSAMDGYAVRCSDLNAMESLEVSQRVVAGGSSEPLAPGTVARIFTGAPIPAGADAVVMQEMAEVDEQGRVKFTQLPESAQWIRRAGEDLRLGQVVVPKGKVLNAFDVGLLASIGAPSLVVGRRLKVGLLITGSELQEPGQPLEAGQIYNSNQYVWQAMLEQLNAEVVCHGIVKDSFQSTVLELERLSSCDVIISSGGVSVGEEDHVKSAVQATGTLESWKVSMKPGKPMAFGRIRGVSGHQAWFFGLPGNPVSSSVAFLLVVKPFLRMLQGQSMQQVDWRKKARQISTRFEWMKPDLRREEFLRATLVDGRLELFKNQSSGVLTSMSQSTGLVRLPAKQVLNAGDLAMYYDFQDLMQ